MTKQGKYKTCERCATIFYEYPYQTGKKRFCSTNCANKTNSAQQRATKRIKAKVNVGVKKWRYNLLYIEWRNFCLIRDSMTCQNCLEPLKPSRTVVHHIKSWRNYPELRYEVSNGQTLCRSCHNKIHILPSRKENSGF